MDKDSDSGLHPDIINEKRKPRTHEEALAAQALILAKLDKAIKALQDNRSRFAQWLPVENEHWIQAAAPMDEVMFLMGSYNDWADEGFNGHPAGIEDALGLFDNENK